MPREHTLTAHDQWFLNERRLDPVTKSEFSAGDTIVICARCKAVSMRDSWDAVGGVCANCQGNAQLDFPDFSRELLQPVSSGNKNFRIVNRRFFPAIRLPAIRLPAIRLPAIRLPSVPVPAALLSPFPTAKLCLRAGVCSVALFVGTCALAYSPLSASAETGAFPEALLVRQKQYLAWTRDRIQEKASRVAEEKTEELRNRLSGVSEKPGTLSARTEIPLDKLRSLSGKADAPMEKLHSLSGKADALPERLSALTNGHSFPETGNNASGQPEQTETGTAPPGLVALSGRNADGDSS